MLCNPTKVPAVIIHALLPVSSQLGTAGAGKLLRLAGGVYAVCANAGCALIRYIRTAKAIAAMVYLLARNFVNLIGMLSESELDSFTSPRLTLHII